MTVGTLAQEIAKLDAVEEAGIELRAREQKVLKVAKAYVDEEAGEAAVEEALQAITPKGTGALTDKLVALDSEADDAVVTVEVQDIVDLIVAEVPTTDVEAALQAYTAKGSVVGADQLVGLDSEGTDAAVLISVQDIIDEAVAAAPAPTLNWEAFTTSMEVGEVGDVTVTGLYNDGAILFTQNTTGAPSNASVQLAVTVADGKFTIKQAGPTSNWVDLVAAVTGWYLVLDYGTAP